MRRLEPDERELPELTPVDWEQAVSWRPLAYRTVRRFVKKATGREVWYSGEIGKPTFQWHIKGIGRSFGVDVVALCQDLEYRALEATAVAFHRYDADKAYGKPVSAHYLEKSIWRALQSEFDRIRRAEPDDDVIPYESMTLAWTGRNRPEPSYLDPHDQAGPGDGLNDEDRTALQTALGVLSSREAWALRMVADDTPLDAIAESLGFKSEGGARNFINEAKRKAQAAYTEAQS